MFYVHNPVRRLILKTCIEIPHYDVFVIKPDEHSIWKENVVFLKPPISPKGKKKRRKKNFRIWLKIGIFNGYNLWTEVFF